MITISSRPLWIGPLVSCLALLLVGSAVPAQELSPEVEQSLLEVLRSDAAKADKALACKKLAIEGSSAAVPELAKLLPDPELSSWARIALEAIPGSEVDAALRSAGDSMSGRQLIGVLNSIGVRRDAGAIALLTRRLGDEDTEVAAAAAVALGRIGTAESTQVLREALGTSDPGLRNAVAEGCVLSAEHAWQQGDRELAIALYDQIRQAAIPLQRQIEATRGAILARGEEGLPLLLETLRSPEEKMFQIGLATAREFAGKQLASELTREVEQAPADRAARLLQVLADRPQAVSLDLFLRAAAEGDPAVRLAAIQALRQVGDERCLAPLVAMVRDADPTLAEAASNTLAELPGEAVNARIVAELRQATAEDYLTLLNLIGKRRISALEELRQALEHPDAEARHAALRALGETVSQEQLPVLIREALDTRGGADRPVAWQALRTASVRMPDRDACATTLDAASKGASLEDRVAMLEILAEVGGDAALERLARAASNPEDALQDAGSRLLGKWNGLDAAPVLLQLAQSAPSEKYQIRALRGYLGLARKFNMPEPDRADMVQQALEKAQRAEEKQLALEVLKLHPSRKGLLLTAELREDEDVAEEAEAAVFEIVQKLGNKRGDLQPILEKIGLRPVQLEIVKAEYGAGSQLRDVTNVLRQQAGNLPLISLSNPSYNTTFGGDPAPGVVKQLRVEYRINGQAGTATFPENATILLPSSQ